MSLGSFGEVAWDTVRHVPFVAVPNSVRAKVILILAWQHTEQSLHNSLQMLLQSSFIMDCEVKRDSSLTVK